MGEEGLDFSSALAIVLLWPLAAGLAAAVGLVRMLRWAWRAARTEP